MNKPILIFGDGAPDAQNQDLTAASKGSLYIDTSNLPSNGGGNPNDSYSWGSISYGGPVTNGQAPTGGVSLAAQMQINGTPEYVIQGVFDNTISTSKNEKWQGSFFGNIPAFQPTNPNANPAYALAIQESPSLGEAFPEIRIRGLNPANLTPSNKINQAQALDESNDLGRLVRSRGFSNFNEVGTASEEIGEISYKPQPDGGRDFISGSSGAPAISFRTVKWSGAYQIGGDWIDVLPSRYAILSYWGDTTQKVIRAFTMGSNSDHGAVIRYCATPGLDKNCDSWATLPVYGRAWRNSQETWMQVQDFGSGTASPIFSGLGMNAKNVLARNFIRLTNDSGNITKSTEAVYSIYGGADYGAYVELVLGANGQLFWNTKKITVSDTDIKRLNAIALTGQFPKFVNAYLNKHSTIDTTISLSEITALSSKIKTLEQRLEKLENANQKSTLQS